MTKEELVGLLKLAGYTQNDFARLTWQHPLGPTVTSITHAGVRMVGHPPYVTYDQCWDEVRSYIGDAT